MPLTDIEVRKSGAHDKTYRVRDGGGMFLEVRPNGSKYWRLKYRFGGKEKLLALGTYPAVTLKEARGKREAAKKKIADGIDPSAAKQAEKRTRQLNAENSFEAIAREWHRKFSTSLSDSRAARNLRRLEVHVFPHVGGQPIGDIEPLDVLPVLQRIEKTGHIETAHRVRSIIGQVMRYAVATGRAKRDATQDLRGAILFCYFPCNRLKPRRKRIGVDRDSNMRAYSLCRLDVSQSIGLKYLEYSNVFQQRLASRSRNISISDHKRRAQSLLKRFEA